MKKLLYTLCATTLLTSIAQAETVSILMEGVPDTEYVKSLLPVFLLLPFLRKHLIKGLSLGALK